MCGKLYIAGIGPGHADFIHHAAERLIDGCDVIIGGKRNLELFNKVDKEKVIIGNNLEGIYEYIKDNIRHKKIVVLVSGDPGIFSIMEFLKNRLDGVDIEVLPGISLFQYLCSRLKLSWNDIYIASLHGREEKNLSSIVKNNRKVILLTGGKYSPQDICRKFVEWGLTGIQVTVGEKLSYPDERIVSGKPEEICGMEFDSLSVMLVESKPDDWYCGSGWKYITPGIPDDMFIRGSVPITKEEIRAVTISKLRLKRDHIVFDIGAGTGSVSIECGTACGIGKVYAVEKDSEALGLIARNIEKFGLDNVSVIKGESPNVLEGLPGPDRVFIGGSGGSMEGILNWAARSDKNVRVVVNAVTIESTYEALEGLKRNGFENIDITGISASKGRMAGGKHIMQAVNPVYIISAEKQFKE